jgi:hypothetical protein
MEHKIGGVDPNSTLFFRTELLELDMFGRQIVEQSLKN